MTAHHDSSVTRLLAAVILSIVAVASGCAQAPSLDDGVTKASQIFEQGNYDGVIALLQPMADRDPNLSTTSLDLLGMAYYNNHQYPKAAAILERAIAPGMFSGMPFGGRRVNMRNFGVLGWCYFHMHDIDQARAAFDKALAKSDFRREPAWDESALRGRGWVRYFQGDFQGAGADVSAAQRLALANPGIIDDRINYDISLGLAYINLGVQRDQVAEAMAHGAEAAAKGAGFDAGKVGQDLAPVYLMLGQRDQAYRLFGGRPLLGIEMQDNPIGASKGVLVLKVTPGSPAEKAGLTAGDVIVAVDGQPVAAAQELSRRVGGSEAGQNLQLDVLRHGGMRKLVATLGRPDAQIAKYALLQPLLKVRPLPSDPVPNIASASLDQSPAGLVAIPPEPAGTSTMVVDMPVTAAEPAVPQVETPVPPELRIESVRVEPQAVKAGERFELAINLFALDQDLRAETVPVVLHYTIYKDGKELARFAPETFQVPNGMPSTIAKKTRTSTTQAKGEYGIDLVIEMGPHRARAQGAFSLR